MFKMFKYKNKEITVMTLPQKELDPESSFSIFLGFGSFAYTGENHSGWYFMFYYGTRVLQINYEKTA